MAQEVQGLTKDGVQGVQGTTRAQELSSVPEISEVPGVSVESSNQEVQGDKGTELPETTNKMKPKKQLSSESPSPSPQSRRSSASPSSSSVSLNELPKNIMDKMEKQNSTDSDINEQKLVPMLSLEEENKEPGVSIIFAYVSYLILVSVDIGNQPMVE